MQSIRKVGMAALATVMFVGAICAQPVYDSRTAGFFASGLRPAMTLDDGRLPDGLTYPVTVQAIEFGFSNAATASFDIYINFYDDPAGDLATVLDVAEVGLNAGTNPALLGSYSLGYTNVPAGFYTTGLLNLPPAALLNLPSQDFAVEIVFAEAGSNPPVLLANGIVSAIFAGGTPAVGTNADIYFRDANNNGFYDSASDGRYFGGGANLAQFYLRLEGQPTQPVNVNVMLDSYLGTGTPVDQVPFVMNNVIYTLTPTGPNTGTFTTQIPDNSTITLNGQANSFLSQSIQVTTAGAPVTADFNGPNGTGQLGADANRDNVIDDADLTIIVLDFGKSIANGDFVAGGPTSQDTTDPNNPIDLFADADGDGEVADSDLTIAILNYGNTGT